ncbi:unnamed protein product [Rotaria sordida]|uniref:Uncharacterized protein n=1 Tax=Rotaria sordida TaxID=392033 RepID=A0A819LWQ1_9BILA|nr:unnamed protein product [Rotaria sordida]
MKKKKSHGNRKEQHKRRRIRHQEQKRLMNNTRNPTGENIIRADNDNEDQNGEQIGQNLARNTGRRKRSKNKRKRQHRNQNEQHINQSLSQLSISQEMQAKRQKLNTTTTTTTISMAIIDKNDQSVNRISKEVSHDKNNYQEEEDGGDIDNVDKEEYTMSFPMINCLQKFKPKYLQVSNRIFKQMLSNAIEDGNKIVQCLNTDEKLQAIRQITEIMNDLHYFQLQENLWQGYYNLGIQENIWSTSELTATTTIEANQVKKYSTYYFPKHLIEKRQKTIVHQIQRTMNQLEECAIYLQQHTLEWQPNIELDLLLRTVTNCVTKAQQRLRKEFQYRIDIAQLDLNDRRSIKYFYNLQPNQEQIRLAKRYWQIVANELRTKEQIEILRQRIFLRRLPNHIDKMIDCSMDHIQPMLSNSVLDKDRRAGLISNYSKTITQYKFDLISLNLNTMENIRRGHQQLLIDFEEKILQTCPNSLRQAIKQRRETMNYRHEKFLEHKLSNFFDEAPTTTLNQ